MCVRIFHASYCIFSITYVRNEKFSLRAYVHASKYELLMICSRGGGTSPAGPALAGTLLEQSANLKKK